MLKFFLVLSNVLFFTSISFASQAQAPNKFYETRICNDCSYNQAKLIATKIKPTIECTRPDRSRPDEEQCWAKTNEIVVFNAITRTSYGFYNGYDNQGQPFYEMNHYVRDITNLPREADIVLNEVVDTYKVIANIAQQLTQDNTLQSQNSINTYGAYAASTASCENSAALKTLKQSFSGPMAASVRKAAQSSYDHGGYFKDTYVQKRITGANFSAGLNAMGFGGTWEYVGESYSVIHKHYDRHSLPDSSENQVGYTLSMLSTGTISISLNESTTLIGGNSLSDLKKFAFSADDLSPCVGEALDKYLPKVVGALGGSPTDSNSPGSGTPSFGGIAITSSGGGQSGGSSTCKHNYYSRLTGAVLFSFEGPCP